MKKPKLVAGIVVNCGLVLVLAITSLAALCAFKEIPVRMIFELLTR